MAVTRTYAFQNLQNFLISAAGAPTPNLVGLDLTSLADGGAGSAGLDGNHIDFNLHEGPELACEDYGLNVTGVDVAIDQLADGDLVLATATAAGEIYYSIADQDGALSANSVSLGAGVLAPDVAALADGGFVVVGQRIWGGTDKDIYVYLRNHDGSERKQVFATDGSVSDDRNASVCALTDGGFAVAWHRDDGAGNTEIRFGVYEANGDERSAPRILDTTGSINRNVSAVALPAGGFALVYEENDHPSFERELTFVKLNSTGLSTTSTRLAVETDGSSAALSPYATMMSNGLVAVTYTYLSPGGPSEQIAVQLVDPSTLAVLSGMQIISDAGAAEEAASSAAGYGEAQLLVGWTRPSEGDAATMRLVRTTTGDNTANTLNGDEAIDIMFGAGGTDNLRGFEGNDVLDGDAGADLIYGGRGFDILTGGGAGDTLTGNQGKDNYRYLSIFDSQTGAVDIIYGLAGKDRIVLADIDANTNKSGDQRFQLVEAFDGHAGEIVVTYHTTGIYGGGTTVELEVTGDFVVDALIVIEGDHEDFTHFVL